MIYHLLITWIDSHIDHMSTHQVEGFVYGMNRGLGEILLLGEKENWGLVKAGNREVYKIVLQGLDTQA